jgi:ribosomal-protein-alanine N-acetyltransferase
MQLFSGFGREIERVLLEVREGNEKAKNFYKKHGFVTIAKRANYYQSPLDDALVMEKQMENIVATGNKLG